MAVKYRINNRRTSGYRLRLQASEALTAPHLQWVLMRVVVTGGTGFLGRPMVARLVNAGHDLTVLTRHAAGRSGVREVEWQPTGDVGPWASELDGADVVINLAGESLAKGRWTAARKQRFRDSRLEATRSVVAGIGQARKPPTALVSASAVGYYGPRGSEIVTESEPAGTDFLGTLARDWEAAALEAQPLGTRVVLLRTGLVLEREGGALQRLLVPYRLGVGGPLGSGQQYWPWIHRNDWMGIVESLLSNPAIDGPVNVTAPTPETNASFSRALATALGRPNVFRVPAAALRLAIGEMADAVLTGQRAIPAKMIAAKHPFAFGRLEDALTAILRG
jgi:uncharacterized protein